MTSESDPSQSEISRVMKRYVSLSGNVGKHVTKNELDEIRNLLQKDLDPYVRVATEDKLAEQITNSAIQDFQPIISETQLERRRFSLPLLRKEFVPWPFQLDIAAKASLANTLVALPPGSGKTFVTILVASNRIAEFSGKVVVTAPNRFLLDALTDNFRKTIDFPERVFVNLNTVKSPEKRNRAWRNSRFIFTTPRMMYQMARSKRAMLRDVVLMIFENPDSALTASPSSRLAKLYKNTAKHPLILGLTSSPLISRKRTELIMKALQIEQLTIMTPGELGYLDHRRHPGTSIQGITVALPSQYSHLIGILREIYSQKIIGLVEAGFLKRAPHSKKSLLQARAKIAARLKTDGGHKNEIYNALINQAQAIMILYAIELAETEGADVLLKYLKRIKDTPEQSKSTSGLLNNPKWLMVEEEAERVQAVEYPKLTELRSIVKAQLAAKADSKIIVFTQYGDTIESIIERLAKDGISTHRFQGMDQKMQTDVLESFSDRDFNVLVTSSIGEEALHVPDVDLVIFFEAVPSEIRAIYRRGLIGMIKPEHVIFLLAEGTVDEAYYYNSLHGEQFSRNLDYSEVKPRKGQPATKGASLLDYVK